MFEAESVRNRRIKTPSRLKFFREFFSASAIISPVCLSFSSTKSSPTVRNLCPSQKCQQTTRKERKFPLVVAMLIERCPEVSALIVLTMSSMRSSNSKLTCFANVLREGGRNAEICRKRSCRWNQYGVISLVEYYTHIEEFVILTSK